MSRTVDVDGQPWEDRWVGVDVSGRPWRLRFQQSDWGPAHDRWVWEAFGTEVVWPLDSPGVEHPLTKVWPPAAAVEDEAPKPKRRAS